MNWHKGIAASLRIGAALLFVLVVATVIWALLAAVGDETWSAGVQGVFLVTAVCSVLNLVTLVVFTAFAQLATSDEPDEK